MAKEVIKKVNKKAIKEVPKEELGKTVSENGKKILKREQ